jgi:PAS domain S-box-containing protein
MLGLDPEAGEERELLDVLEPLLDAAAREQVRAAIAGNRQILLHLHDDFGARSLRLVLKPAALAGAWIGSLVPAESAALDIESATIARVERDAPVSALADPPVGRLRWIADASRVELAAVTGAMEALIGRDGATLRADPELLFAATDPDKAEALRGALARARVRLEPFRMDLPINDEASADDRWIAVMAVARRDGESRTVIDAVVTDCTMLHAPPDASPEAPPEGAPEVPPEASPESLPEVSAVMLPDVPPERPALAQSQRRLREFTRLLPGAMFLCSLEPQPTITYLSDGAERLLGLPAASLVGEAEKLLAVIDPDDEQALRTRLAEAASELRPWRFDVAFRDSAKRLVSARIVAEPVVSADAGAYYYGLLLDSTELEAARRTLAERESMLQSVCVNAGIGLIEWEIETGAVKANAKLREIYGLGDADAALAIDVLLAREHTADAARKRRDLETLLAGEIDEFYCAYRVKRDDGNWRWVLGIGRISERAADGAPLRFVGTVRAVTTRNELDGLGRRGTGGRVAGLSDRFGIPGCLFELRRGPHGRLTLPFLAGDLSGIDPSKAVDPFAVVIRRIDRRDLRVLSESCARAAALLESWECDFRIKDEAGRTRWIYLRAEPARVGESVVFSGFALDVTIRKRTEQALVASEKRFRDLYDFAPIMLYSVDSQGRITNVNQQWLAALGYDRGEIIGKRAQDLMSGSARRSEEVRALIDAHDEDLDAVGCALSRADGRVIEVLLSMRAERDADGVFLGAQFSAIDVTERNLAVKALADSQSRYRTVVHDQTEVICRFDRSGKVEFVNDAGVRMTGRHVDHLVGSSWFELIDPGVRSQLEAALAALSPEAPITRQELRVAAASDRWYQWTIRAFFDPGGALSGYQAVGRDIDQIKQLESQIREVSNREQKRIGHDLHDGLGQELTGISLMLKTLERDVERTAPGLGPRVRSVHEMVAQCISSAKALAQGLAPVHLEGDGFGGAMGQLAANMESVYGIPVNYYGARGVSMADEGLATDLYRIVQEALSNAAKHAKARKIALRLRFEGRDLLLEVEDDGVGLKPAAERPRGMGLKIMQYRANIVGASLSFEQGSRGGTLVRCRVHDFLAREQFKGSKS